MPKNFIPKHSGGAVRNMAFRSSTGPRAATLRGPHRASHWNHDGRCPSVAEDDIFQTRNKRAPTTRKRTQRSLFQSWNGGSHCRLRAYIIGPSTRNWKRHHSRNGMKGPFGRSRLPTAGQRRRVLSRLPVCRFTTGTEGWHSFHKIRYWASVLSPWAGRLKNSC